MNSGDESLAAERIAKATAAAVMVAFSVMRTVCVEGEQRSAGTTTGTEVVPWGKGVWGRDWTGGCGLPEIGWGMGGRGLAEVRRLSGLHADWRVRVM